jgi:hypothetical protein
VQDCRRRRETNLQFILKRRSNGKPIKGANPAEENAPWANVKL